MIHLVKLFVNLVFLIYSMCIFRALIYDSIFFFQYSSKKYYSVLSISNIRTRRLNWKITFISLKKVKKKKVRNSEFMNLDLFKINQRNSFQQFSEKCWFSLKYVIREKTDTCEWRCRYKISKCCLKTQIVSKKFRPR